MYSQKKIFTVLSFFVFFNALKIALFNIFTIYTDSLFFTFSYKMILSISVNFIIYYLIFKIKKRSIFTLVYLFQIVYILGMLVHFIYFRRHLHVFYSVDLTGEGLEALANFAIPRSPKLFITFLDLPFFIYIFKRFKNFVNPEYHHKYLKKSIIFLSIFFIFIFEVINIHSEVSFYHMMNSTKINDNDIALKYGTMAINIIDLINLNRKGIDFTENIEYGEKIEKTKNYLLKNNIIIIQVESLDSNLIGLTYENKEITPFMNKLAEKSIYFPYTLSYHKAGGTSDCEISVLNNFEPFDSFPTSQLENYYFLNSITHNFKKSGYSTKAFHGNKSTFYKRNEIYPLMGFDVFYGYEEMEIEPSIWGALDHEVIEYMKTELLKETEPFFYYFITMTTHAPFNFIEENYVEIEEDPKDKFTYNYFNSFRYFDNHLEDLVNYITENFPNTYIFIFGDHTAAINTQTYTSSAFIDGINYFEFVPTFIITPNSVKYHEKNRAISFLDVGISVLEAAQINYSIKTLGENLFAPEKMNKKIPLSGNVFDRIELFETAIENIEN